MKENVLMARMMEARDERQVAGLSRFFKTGPGQYGEGDKFLGIKVPVTRKIVKEYWLEVDADAKNGTGRKKDEGTAGNEAGRKKDEGTAGNEAGRKKNEGTAGKRARWEKCFGELEECIGSEYHEVRLAALLSLVQIFKHAKKDKALQESCVEFYLAHTASINNWDLVDLSCYEILGPWLMDKDRTLLYDLARNGKTIWEQRIGMVSTMAFIRAGQLDDAYAIAQIFCDKPAPLHDLLQKAAGWLLREAGKRDEQRLKDWLAPRCCAMPRTMLRYAIEKFPEDERRRYLNSGL